jgi:hypothetical protein
VTKPVPPYLSHKVAAGMTVKEAEREFEERLAKGLSYSDIMRLETAMTAADRIKAVEEFRRLHPRRDRIDSQWMTAPPSGGVFVCAGVSAARSRLPSHHTGPARSPRSAGAIASNRASDPRCSPALDSALATAG